MLISERHREFHGLKIMFFYWFHVNGQRVSFEISCSLFWKTCLRKNACSFFFLIELWYLSILFSFVSIFLQSTFYLYSVRLIDYYGIRVLWFFSSFLFFFLTFRPCPTHDWHAEDETVNTLLRTRSRPVVTYARLDLGAADPSDVVVARPLW